MSTKTFANWAWEFQLSGAAAGAEAAALPDLGALIAGTDLHGKLGNFLAVTEDYEFVRDLHRKNLIIPLAGDFGGKKALAGEWEIICGRTAIQ